MRANYTIRLVGITLFLSVCLCVPFANPECPWGCTTNVQRLCADSTYYHFTGLGPAFEIFDPYSQQGTPARPLTWAEYLWRDWCACLYDDCIEPCYSVLVTWSEDYGWDGGYFLYSCESS